MDKVKKEVKINGNVTAPVKKRRGARRPRSEKRRKGAR